MLKSKSIAHRRESDGTEQFVRDHLEEVSLICRCLAEKIGVPKAGELLGLLHDFGKYSHDFQTYIRSATGILNPDADDEYVDAQALKGKIDHSTAGAQWIWQQFSKHGTQGKLIGQILAVCLVSHHGGLLDCLKPGGENGFAQRINKGDAKTHLRECLRVADKEAVEKLKVVNSEEFFQTFFQKLVEIVNPQQKESETIKHFRLGFFCRFLFSCLIDADRVDSADFENPGNRKARQSGPVNWQAAIDRLENKISAFDTDEDINRIRREISDNCRKRANEQQGVYSLTVPTGGGKTFASMRYALHHAKQHKLDRIIYVIPYTSIIEQNAGVIRDVLEREGDDFPWVLEHHSNLEPEKQTWHTKLSAENWDAPIIFTTMVQFLEVLFGGGTRGARKMHNLANSVLVFDEIQCLPVKCVHIFCNGLQFLVDHAKTTAVLCTATQPLLNDLKEAARFGQLAVPPQNELVPNVTKFFDQLKRVRIKNRCRPTGWSAEEISELAVKQYREKGNCLVIVNTKDWARKLYESCKNDVENGALFHLSTSLYPAHRKKILNKIIVRLKVGQPVLCVSTQLIEAGVDIDFNAVIRFLAGLDSIAQAAGRCNRNARLDMADVFVVNPQEEPINRLEDIKEGRESSLRIFSEKQDADLLDPEVMRLYFAYYFYNRADLMTYPLTTRQAGRNDTLLNLLSNNPLNVGREQDSRKSMFMLQQSFKTAGRAFAAIEAPTQAVIVQHGEGRKIVADLCGAFEPAKSYKLLKRAQKYSVNVFPHIWDKLVEERAVHPIQDGEEIYYLDERYYSDEFGLSTEPVGGFTIQIG